MKATRESGKTNANTYWFAVGPARVTTVRPLDFRAGNGAAGEMGTWGGLNEAREEGSMGGEGVREAVLEMRSFAMAA